jgi:hypothetical protein
MLALAAGAFLLGSLSLKAENNILSTSNISAKDGWKVFIHNDNRKAGTKLTWEDNAGKIVIEQCARKDSYTVQLYTNTDVLMLDKQYKVSFELESDKAGTAEVTYILGTSPYSSYAKQVVKVEPGKKMYDCVLTPKKAMGDYKSPRSLRFFLGSLQGGKVAVAKVKVEAVN